MSALVLWGGWVLAWIGLSVVFFVVMVVGGQILGFLHRREIRRLGGPTGSQLRDRAGR